MSDGHQLIAAEATRLAESVPHAVITTLCDSIDSCDISDWNRARECITAGIAHATYRSLVVGFIECWRGRASEVSAEAVSTALRTAAHSEKTQRDHQSVEIVWTGPETEVVSFRRTEQALLQVIDTARDAVLIVSYAVYKIPRICDALLRAAGRGVRITVVVETPNRLESQNTYSTLEAIGSQVADKSSVYYWPLENRPKDDNGRCGILHVKCAVSDSKTLLLTSANLTEYAFTTNMELGLLVTGGNLPKQIEQHFNEMIQMGILSTP
jgi:phosphatidylserine/phosphatidylglycerophosphate/cardiolipin synthase-like enzyme